MKRLIDAGKEKGYLTYNEVNVLIPHDTHSPEDLDDVLATIGRRGIDVLEGQRKLLSSVLKRKFGEEAEPGEDIGLDLGPGVLEQTDDPVRIYLREMRVVPLLTREGEVDIAKRIERGQLRVLKALSRSPMVIRQIVAIGEDLKRWPDGYRPSWQKRKHGHTAAANAGWAARSFGFRSSSATSVSPTSSANV